MTNSAHFYLTRCQSAGSWTADQLGGFLLDGRLNLRYIFAREFSRIILYSGTILEEAFHGICNRRALRRHEGYRVR